MADPFIDHIRLCRDNHIPTIEACRRWDAEHGTNRGILWSIAMGLPFMKDMMGLLTEESTASYLKEGRNLIDLFRYMARENGKAPPPPVPVPPAYQPQTQQVVACPVCGVGIYVNSPSCPSCFEPLVWE